MAKKKSKYVIGDIVLCPASGPVAGPRQGRVIDVIIDSVLVTVEYINPADKHNNTATVKPIRNLTRR